VEIKRTEIAGGAAFSVLLVAQLFGANLNADFWLIDDHQILTFIHKAGGGFRDFFHLFRFSEIAHFGAANRYRPGYYTLYILDPWCGEPIRSGGICHDSLWRLSSSLRVSTSWHGFTDGHREHFSSSSFFHIRIGRIYGHA
jgi:hypothetical protein